jgi:hypothetical protein
MKNSLLLLGSLLSLGAVSSVSAQTTVNITGATAFRSAAIKSIVAGYGGEASVGIIHSNTSTSNYDSANAISFRGNWPVVGDTIIRCRFSGSTEGIRDLTQNNDVLFYADASIPSAGTITFVNANSNPTTGSPAAATAFKADLAFSDVQQANTPYRTTTLSPSDSRVGVIAFVFLKSQGSSAAITNVTDQSWGALLRSSRGVPLSTFTGNTSDSTGRVLATGRNDGSGTRAVALIETGYGVSRLVNHFKISKNGSNSFTLGNGSSTDAVNYLSLWPSSDAENADNNSALWNSLTTGNGGYFSGSGVTGLLTKDTSSVRVFGPSGNTDLSTSGSYTSTNGTARAFSVIGMVGASDAVAAFATNNGTSGAGGAGLLAYNGATVTPLASGVNANGFSDADRYKISNGIYTLWTYERLYHKGSLSANQDAVVYTASTGIVAKIPDNIGNNGVALSAMTASRTNDGDVVTVP